jgi:MYXO-CTERM domain-containing protein
MVSTMLLGLGSIAPAQTQPTNDTTTTRTDDRSHGNWGWLGLLGLVGLFGLKRRETSASARTTTPAATAVR